MHAVDDIRKRIESRLEELDIEREQLMRALAALNAGETPRSAPRPAPRTPAKRPRRTASGRAKRGQNVERILAVLKEEPGLAPREIAARTGIDARVISTTMSKLRKAGKLEPAGSAS